MPVRWNTDKPHRCPACHAVTFGGDQSPNSWSVYTCCRCATRFTRWPRLWRLLRDAGVCCPDHTSVRDGLLDSALHVIADPWWRARGVGWEDAHAAVTHLKNRTHPAQYPVAGQDGGKA